MPRNIVVDQIKFLCPSKIVSRPSTCLVKWLVGLWVMLQALVQVLQPLVASDPLAVMSIVLATTPTQVQRVEALLVVTPIMTAEGPVWWGCTVQQVADQAVDSYGVPHARTSQVLQSLKTSAAKIPSIVCPAAHELCPDFRGYASKLSPHLPPALVIPGIQGLQPLWQASLDMSGQAMLSLGSPALPAAASLCFIKGSAAMLAVGLQQHLHHLLQEPGSAALQTSLAYRQKPDLAKVEEQHQLDQQPGVYTRTL